MRHSSFSSRRQFLGLGAMAGAGLLLPSASTVARAGPLPAIPETDAVIAFGHVGPVSDEGWTWSHDQGMKAVQAAFPRLRTIVVESIPGSADATRTFRQLVAQKASMIFATSQYGDFLRDVSKRAPNVAFLEANGMAVHPNHGWYYISQWYVAYLIGISAGLMSKSGRIGYIAPFPVAPCYAAVNGLLLGARSVRPEATVQVVTINSWFDPPAATQAAIALANSGCDFLFGLMDEPAYLQVAEQRGIKAAMFNTDVRRFGPKAYVSSVILDWRKFYVEQVGKRLSGTWEAGGTLLPFGDGVDRDAWGETVPEPVARQADAVRTKMLAGYSPFVGEIKDNKGTVRVPRGKTMTDLEFNFCDWAIDGVAGLGA